MKTVIITIIMLVSSLCLSAQGLGDVFNQKKKEKQNMIQQILFNQAYHQALKTGYKVCKDGWNTVQGFKNGEFHLHQLFFNSLKNVNGVVKKYNRVAEIIMMQVEILQIYKRFNTQIRQGANDIKSVPGFYKEVLDRVLSDCDQMIDELALLTTDGKLEMKDDERISRIDRLHRDMQEQLTFTRNFSNETLVLYAAKQHEHDEVQFLKNLQK